MSETFIDLCVILGILLIIGGVLFIIFSSIEIEPFFSVLGLILIFGGISLFAFLFEEYSSKNDSLTEQSNIETIVHTESATNYEVNVDYDNGTYTITIKE